MAGAAAARVTPHMKKQAKARLVQEQKQIEAVRPKRPTAKRAKKKSSPFKFRLFLLFLLTIALAQLGIYAYSQNSELVIEVLKFPGRLVTTTACACVGAVKEGFNGIIVTEQHYAQQTFAHAKEDPMMIPAGIVGVAIAIPVGFVMGAPDGIMEYGQQGYEWWDKLS